MERWQRLLPALDEEFSRIHRDEIIAVRKAWPELENMQLTW
jgi:hypothetical protein